jgi:hypothetical protein
MQPCCMQEGTEFSLLSLLPGCEASGLQSACNLATETVKTEAIRSFKKSMNSFNKARRHRSIVTAMKTQNLN